MLLYADKVQGVQRVGGLNWELGMKTLVLQCIQS